MSDIIVQPKKGDLFRFTLPQREVTIGRLATNDLPISDQYSSGSHAAIFPLPGGGFAVRDLGSKNGTSVNDRKISGETELKRGDKILIGSTLVYFEDFQTEVIITPRTDITHSSNTIIQVKDILNKPPTAAIPLVETAEDTGGLKRDLRVSRVLADVNQALMLHMSLDKLLDHIMDLIIKNIPMDRGILMLKEGKPEQLKHRVSRVLNPGRAGQKILISQSIVQTALDKNSAVLVADIRGDDRYKDNPSIVGTNIHSAMCVPLWNDREVVGLLYADRISILEQFREEDLRLLTFLANTAALKIESARRYEDERIRREYDQQMDLARQIQENFLPRRPPAFPPFEICGSMRACHHVGGDYYDFISVGEGRLAVIIADVSGSGFSSALQMSNFRGALHARIHGNRDLAGLTSGLNEFVHASSESHMFISFFIGVLDPERGEMDYVNAGHNPPFVLDAEGRIQTLDSTGFCLGMFPSAGYEKRTTGIGPGDLVCIFTDGIIEGRNRENEEYGEERLAALIRETARQPAGEVMDEIYKAVFGFSECTEAGDDMTLIIIKRTPEASSR